MPKPNKEYGKFIANQLNLYPKEKNENNSQQLVNLLYKNNSFDFAKEKRILINEFFADLFTSEFNWIITNNQNQQNKSVHKIFLKYLESNEFNLKSWFVHYKAGFDGKYGLLLNKEEKEELDAEGFNINEPNIVPVKINYENRRNDQLIEAFITYDNNLIYGTSIYTLNEIVSIFENTITVTRSIWDLTNNKQVDSKKYKKIFTLDTINSLKLEKTEKINQKFLPIEILKINKEGLPRTKHVDNKLVTLAAYDESLAILPFWERGGIMRNGKDVLPENVTQQNYKFMEQLLLKGFSDIKPNAVDQYSNTLQEQIVTWQPRSIMQTMRNTRNDMWNEIKEDLGIPNLDEIKSAQQSTAEIYAKQFLTSPTIEREKMLFLNFLSNFGKKFLMFLNQCNISEKNDIKDIDFSKWKVKVTIDLTTDKNIASSIQMMSKKGIEKEEINND